MSRLFALTVACCAKFETGQTFSYVQTDATTPKIVGPTMLGNCCVRLHVASRVYNEATLGTGHYLSPKGRGEDLGLNKVKSSRSPLWMLCPLITFDDFRDPLHVFIFQANMSGPPPLNPTKVFSDPPFWVLSNDWSPLLFCYKWSDPLLKSFPPPPEGDK